MKEVKKNIKAGDPYVLNVQKWVNNNFGYDERFTKIDESGIIGWGTIYGLTKGLQICLGLPTLADNFGTSTESAFLSYTKNHPIEEDNNFDDTQKKINGIVQGALICKGYDIGTNTPTGTFGPNTAKAIKKLKRDAGIDDSNSIVSLNLMKALLSMDYFTSYDTSEKTKKIMAMQRYLNGNYEEYTGIRPCDGVFGRRTSMALIYAIQCEEGIPIKDANGNCGPTTKKCLPPIPYNGGYDYNGIIYGLNYIGEKYSTTTIDKFKILANIGLYFNGFGQGELISEIDSAAVTLFQRRYAIPDTGKIDYTTWLSLLISCGNTDRSAIACDCATIITQDNIEVLKKNQYHYIGRYLSGNIWNSELGQYVSKALTLSEIKLLFNNDIRLFPIHQGAANSLSYFTTANAEADAKKAVERAKSFYLQFGTIIYFAVDFDATNSQITNNIIPYFKTLYKTFMNSCNGQYRVGIYGTRNVCEKVCNSGYAYSSFVSDMSTGFSGNLGFVIPSNWALDQFATTKISYGGKSIEIDKDDFSGNYLGISQEYSLPETEDTSNLNTLTNSFLLANMGASSIPVYESKVHKNWELPQAGTQYVVDGKKIGEIKINDFYLFFGVTNPSTDNVHKVLFNDGIDVKMGFITGSYEDIDAEKSLKAQNWDQKLKNQEPYSCVRYIPEDNKYEVISSSQEQEILINKPVVYFDTGGNYQGMLNKGDKIYISSGNFNNTGVSRPWCYRVSKFIKNGELINKNMYVSSGLEYASSGADRAWY